MDTGLAPFVTKEALALTDADLLPNGKIRSMEKAKANNLVRQLQMRLQYARLKVDHGWQKQRLNEVENLYFRQQKQSDSPVKSTYPTTAVLSTPLDPQLLAQSQPEDSGSNSSLSFRLPAPSEAPEGLGDAPTDSIAASALHVHTNGSLQSPVNPTIQGAPQAGPSSSNPPALPQDLSSWVPDPTPGTVSQEVGIPSPAASTTSTTPSQSLPQSRPLQSSVPGPSTAPLTYESFWSSGVVPLPQPLDGQRQMVQGAVLAPGFTPTPYAPRNGKGKGRVAGGSVVKRKSAVVTQSGYAVV